MFGSNRPIVIRRNHSLDRENVRNRVEDVAREMKQNLNVTYQWQGDRLTFERLGAHGHIHLNGDEVEVKVIRNSFLPISERWLKDKIHEYLDHHLD